MTIQSAPRTVILTVWKLEADMIDITGWDGVHAYVPGRMWAHARGGDITHSWEIDQADRICLGDTITIDIAPPRQAGT